MAEEFQGGICGGSWWTSSRNLFGSSPCSLATNDFGWPNHDPIMDMRNTGSSDDSTGSASDGGSSLVLQNVRLSSTNPDAWNQDFLHDSGKSEQNYSNVLQEAVGLDWSSKNFSEHSSFNSFRQVNQSFPLEQPPLNSISSSTESAGFPLNSASYSYTSSLLQTLFDTDSQPQQALLDNQAMNYSSFSSSAPNYQVNNSKEFLPGLTKASPMINPSFAKQNNPINNLPFSANNAPLWNAQFLPSSVNKKPNLPTFRTTKNQNEEARNLASAAKKANNEPAFKRSRIETPSPLPTFKVRKEKLGDRITALQQLVSPFGKTDTASVLHEAIEYIKYLHDQVSVYSVPYLKNGSSLQRQQAGHKVKDQEMQTQDLKSRGLCLVPISSTFPVAAETTADFWTPTFGGSFK